MQIYSLSAAAFFFLGLLFTALSFLLSNFVEYLFVIGLIFMLAGAVTAFKAMAAAEAGKTKYVVITAFFSILFVIAMTAPFHFVRVVMWIKNSPIIQQLVERMEQLT
ncbi:hypothetical protein [Bacillus thermotolerans]|mgnify:CR=1 FL=1|uniref:Uncharacterized protein n=1 Tax=Bacillus thermotolerans TaxID=1221996 RepID=A0A0F5ICU8_BACTR|nr:hypothetical protein [Bacillus thermotolerans]KKB34796.1 hypothetical protein QY97_02104 [Bacillus thermotolerans]KKB36687.1 hypothetical protein QY96_03415 [Bacillus thermotolerans]KKB43336.1 hypothetical protein QY95_01581 [Bacillus thermotolerans]